MKIPDEILNILNILEDNKYEAWLTGGCVRDSLLDRPIHDWDIATSALPEQVTELFPRTVPTGIQHGTVTVLTDGLPAEITTFRSDGIYMDGRHPDQVRFVANLSEDLWRRDFTVNAIAFSRQGKLVDLTGGLSDLMQKTIRCVGNPDVRFHEDALRMLRALRFSAQLNFTIEDETLAAIYRCAPLADQLSAERVRGEMEKTLLSDHPEYLNTMIQAGLLHCSGLSEPVNLKSIRVLPVTAEIRWAALLLAAPELNLSALHFPTRVIRTVQNAVRNCGTDLTPAGLRQIIYQDGLDCARITTALLGRTEMLNAELAAGHCLSLRDLAVRGTDFPQLSGPDIGKTLRRLMEHVLLYPEDNQKEKLLLIAQSMDYPDI